MPASPRTSALPFKQSPTRRGALRLLALCPVALAGGAALGACRRASATDGDSVALPSFAYRSKSVQLGYRFALQQPELLAQLVCYCGCSQLSPQHTSLRDCYLKPGGGFDEHASGCTVCVDEALDAKRLLGDGRSVKEIRTYIDATYGDRGKGTDTPPVI